MAMSDRKESSAVPPAFRRAWIMAYGSGMLLCVIWPLILQGLLGRVIQPGMLNLESLAQDLGYTFTGLVILSALFVVRRSKNVRAGFSALEARKRSRVMVMEILLYSAIFGLSTLFGLVYHGMGGPQAERYARTFIALSMVMFLLFVPRLSAWRKAMNP